MRFRSPQNLIRMIVVFSAVVVLFGIKNSAQTPPPCQPPPGLGTGAVWRLNAAVNVAIDPTFSSSEESAVRGQLSKWRNAGSLNITFNYPAIADLGPGASGGGNPIYFILRETPADPSSQGSTGGFAVNGRRGDSTTKINPGVTNATTFAQVVFMKSDTVLDWPIALPV